MVVPFLPACMCMLLACCLAMLPGSLSVWHVHCMVDTLISSSFSLVSFSSDDVLMIYILHSFHSSLFIDLLVIGDDTFLESFHIRTFIPFHSHLHLHSIL